LDRIVYAVQQKANLGMEWLGNQQKLSTKKNLNRDCQRPEISLLSLKNVANFLKQLQEERCICVKLKSGLLVGLHVTVVYVIANNVREKNVIANKHAVKDLRSHLTVRY